MLNFLFPLFLLTSCTSYRVVKHEDFQISKVDYSKIKQKYEKNQNIFENCKKEFLEEGKTLTDILEEKQQIACFVKVKNNYDILIKGLFDKIDNSNNANEKNELILK